MSSAGIRNRIGLDLGIMVLEMCVDSLDSAITAARGGADRVELCSDLMEGGITPSSGLIQAVRAAIDIDLFVMIRPRGGDLLYSDSEIELMALDIVEAKRLGCDGVVLGMLTVDGQVDIARTEELVKLAAPMQVTFHRAIDMTPNPAKACEDVLATGAHRILTSGGKQTALLGAQEIAQMVVIARGKIAIMAGSGIDSHNVAKLARASGVTEFHASLRKRVESPVTYRKDDVHMGNQKNLEFIRYELREEDVRALRQAVDHLAKARLAEHSVQ
jgi:copper homeostasis protein